MTDSISAAQMKGYIKKLLTSYLFTDLYKKSMLNPKSMSVFTSNSNQILSKSRWGNTASPEPGNISRCLSMAYVSKLLIFSVTAICFPLVITPWRCVLWFQISRNSLIIKGARKFTISHRVLYKSVFLSSVSQIVKGGSSKSEVEQKSSFWPGTKGQP